MAQNTSHAVMAQRREPHDSLEHFPTPPWAARALVEHVLTFLPGPPESRQRVWEPACAEGHMARPLAEYFRTVQASDVHPYGFGALGDFLWPTLPEGIDPEPDWIITNPPFRQGEQFARRALTLARRGVALLVRTAFLEGVERHRLYAEHPPAVVAQFSERVIMAKGRLLDPSRLYPDPETGKLKRPSTATAYAWIVWHRGMTETRMRWIPPCRRQLERDGDYPALEAVAA